MGQPAGLTREIPRGESLEVSVETGGGAKGPAEAPVGWRRLFAGWMAITARFGFTQTLVILTLFYALLFGPVALVIALARRDLLERGGLRAGGTAWRDADSAPPDLERARLAS
jgi:hypothetical protein